MPQQHMYMMKMRNHTCVLNLLIFLSSSASRTSFDVNLVNNDFSGFCDSDCQVLTEVTDY